MAFDPRQLDTRQAAIVVSRARCVVGLSCIFLPGAVTKVWFGDNSPATKAVTRFAGIRDLALGVGALTNLKEHGQDAEWVSMAAVSDGVDGIVSLFQAGLPKRSRVFGIGAFAFGAYLLKLSRSLAAERQTA